MVMARRGVSAGMRRDAVDAVAKNLARRQALGAADQHDCDQQNGQFGMESQCAEDSTLQKSAIWPVGG
jgi:hypothetical protein